MVIQLGHHLFGLKNKRRIYGMANYADVAGKIIEAVGGKDNIRSIQHCMTRLRLDLKERERVDEEMLKQIEFVKGINDSNGQLQIILGTGIVNKVYKAIGQFFDVEGQEQIEKKGGNLFQRLSRIFGDIFIPIIPVIIASGLLMGVRTYFTSAGILATDGAWYKIFAILIDTGFAVLPALVAWSSAKKFGGNPAMGFVLGMMLISSNLPSGGAVGRGLAEPLNVQLFGIDFFLKGYQGSILIAVVGGWILAFVEDKVRKIVPNVVDMIFTPILTFTITLFVILFGIGPMVQYAEELIIMFYEFVLTIPYGIGGFITGALQQPLVITGMHHGLWILDINFLEETGMNMYQPIRNASVLGQAGAALAFAVFAREKMIKSNALTASVGAMFGITEPAIFGVTLVYGIPFLFGMLGSGLGGMFGAITHLAAPGMGTAGIPGLLYYIGNSSDLTIYIIQSLITLSVPFVLTTIYLRRKKV